MDDGSGGKRRSLTRRACLAGSAFAALEAAYLGVGAAGCDDGTTGRRILLETRVESDLAEGQTLTTVDGWAVTVTRALLSVGDVVYLEGAPIAWRPAAWIAQAHAHPGHYREGNVLGEVHAPTLVDLLAGPTSLGVTEAVTGRAQSATFGFYDPAAGEAPTEEDAVVTLEGIASRAGDDDRPFVVHVYAADLLSSATELPEVAGCVLDAGDFESDGAVTVTVRTELWLEQVDFSAVPPGESQELAADEPPRNAFVRGVKKAAAYAFTYEVKT